MHVSPSDGPVQNGPCKEQWRGSGVALRAHIPRHATSQKQRFCIPLMVPFKLPHANKCGLGQGWHSVRTYPCILQPRNSASASTWLVVRRVCVHGAPPLTHSTILYMGHFELRAHIPLHTTTQKQCFCIHLACSAQGMCAQSVTVDPLHNSVHGAF